VHGHCQRNRRLLHTQYAIRSPSGSSPTLLATAQTSYSAATFNKRTSGFLKGRVRASFSQAARRRCVALFAPDPGPV
jgi:hypothetical protein